MAFAPVHAARLQNNINNAFRSLPHMHPPVKYKARKTYKKPIQKKPIHKKPIQKIPSEGSSGSVYYSAESEFAPPIPEWIPSEESLSSKNKGSLKKKGKESNF